MSKQQTPELGALLSGEQQLCLSNGPANQVKDFGLLLEAQVTKKEFLVRLHVFMHTQLNCFSFR